MTCWPCGTTYDPDHGPIRCERCEGLCDQCRRVNCAGCDDEEARIWVRRNGA